jgi:hypothetical protein
MKASDHSGTTQNGRSRQSCTSSTSTTREVHSSSA